MGISLSNTPGKLKSKALRKKIRLIFSIALIGLVGVIYASCSTILLASLIKVEKQNTQNVIKGVMGILTQRQEDFSNRFIDWSAWDDTYTFVQDANNEYIQSNLIPESILNIKLNLAVFIQPSGRIVFGTGFDLIHKKKKPIPEDLRSQLSPQKPLLQHSSPKSSVAGIVLLKEGLMTIISRPILTSEFKGPIRGALIFGRYLDTEEIARLSKIARLPLQIYPINAKNLPLDFQAVRDEFTTKFALNHKQQTTAASTSDPILVRQLNEQTIVGYSLLKDIYGKPAGILRVDVPREIYQQGQASLRYLMMSLSVASLVFATVTLPLLERSLLFRYKQREKEERYRAVVEQASEGIFLVDADSKRLLEANAALANLLGYTTKEVIELTLYDIVAQEPESIDDDIRYLMQQHQLNGAKQYRLKNGSLVDVEVSANLISYEQRDALCIVVRDITERQKAFEALRESEKRLSWQASHDALTKLVNRHEFEHLVQQAVLDAKTGNHQHALCYLDLDQFKIINDTCGHLAGDDLLRQVSTVFQSGLRKTDTLARLSGDEFGILLYHCPIENAAGLANLLREQIQKFRFVWQEKTLALSVSIGVVAIVADTPNIDSVFSAADTACYAAKNNGRNRVHVYQPDDQELAIVRGQMQWASRIPAALAENRFRLYYQTIVPITQAANRKIHREILLRLQDETGNIVSPMAFIPAAERYNLMHLIDRWVISTLFIALRQQQTQNHSYIYAVNLSGASINDDQFIHFVQSQFEINGISPSIICFEVTETIAITNLAKAAQLIEQLKALGCKFALDDFGSGMSSFAYLKNLPLDYVKIDGVFIKDIVTDAIACSMVEAIARIASLMSIQTIAEFVENDAIVALLQTLEVDYAQGYGIARPCPLEEPDICSINKIPSLKTRVA